MQKLARLLFPIVSSTHRTMQTNRTFTPILLPSLVLALALASCSSPDKTAARAAADADIELQQGRTAAALRSAQEAIAARDDVSDYWLLLGRINMATGDYGGAFTAYENVIQLDRSNVEAVRLLCQLGLTVRQPDKVDKYADMLMLLTPGDNLPLVMKGGAALQRGDKTAALDYADKVLAKNPADAGAQILKARVLAARRQFNDAAALIEGSLTTQGDNTPRLNFLKDLYRQSFDRPHYNFTIKRLALTNTKDPNLQLEYADMLYQTGQQAEASKVVSQVMLGRPSDIALAENILELWLTEGPDAVPMNRLAAQAAAMSLEMKSVYAQYANEIGHPEIAIAILGRETDAPLSSENSDAKAALAYAMGLQGHRSDAIGRLDDIIAFDPAQPRALLARARLSMANGQLTGAITDARKVVAGDPHNATARLALVNMLLAHGDADLAAVALREGVRAMPDDVRLTARLAKTLMASGRADAAKEALRDLTRAAPTSLRAERLRASLDPTAVPDKPEPTDPVAPTKTVTAAK